VIRNADSFTCSISPDGNNWSQVGSPQTFPTEQTVYVGLGVDSGSITASGTATFDSVTVTAGSSLPNPVVTGVAPTSGAPGTTVTITGQGFGATQSSSSVLFNSATAAISSWSDTSIVAVVPPGASTGPVGVEVANITGQGPTFSVSLTVQVTDSLGNQSSYISQPAGGQWDLISAQGSGCSTCTTRGTVSKQFDANGNVLWQSDALEYATTYQYDFQNNLLFQSQQLNGTTATSSYSYNSFGEVTSFTDAGGSQTANTYDAKGNLTSITSPNSAVTQFAYDSKGELTTITDPLNSVTTLTYTPVGLIASITDAQSNVTTYQYDAHGNRTSVTDAMLQQTTFAYDAGDRLTTITYPGGTTTSFTYDSRGRRTSVTDQNSKTTTYAYDDADRLTSVTDPATNVTTYAYDTENNLTGITDANGHTTNFSYDAFGRVTRTTFPSSLTELYTYDADNNLTSKTDRKGQTITYVYDALNRLSTKRYTDGSEVDYVYDLVGKIQNVNDPTGTYAFAYDTSGRLIGTTTSYSFLLARNFTTAYGYDAASNRTSFTDPESDTTSYAYDTLNRLTTLTPPAAFTATGSFGFAYDALSRRTSLTRPNSVSTTYTYDDLSRLLGAVHKLGATTLDGATYTVDNAGNRSSKADLLAGVTSNYTYDALYELTQTAQGGSATESYTYDPVGNRLTSLAASYTVNTSNELTARTGVSYSYDYNGNTISRTDSTGTTNYSWDVENRLTSVTLPGTAGTVSFKYDPFGRRIYKSSSLTGTSIFAYDGNNLIEEANSSGTAIARYSQTDNADEPLAMLRGGATNYYHADGLGSITSLSNGAGALAQSYTFDSFGKQTASSGSLTNPFRYTARESDTETDLYYYRARYYASDSGRFLSEDPISLMGGVNMYVYVGNSPLGSRDPSGLCPEAGPIKLPLANCICTRNTPLPRMGFCRYTCDCGAGPKLKFGYTSSQRYLLEGMVPVKGCSEASKQGKECPEKLNSIEINIKGDTSYVLTSCEKVH
jgi:RHS repeat-associated protein